MSHDEQLGPKHLFDASVTRPEVDAAARAAEHKHASSMDVTFGIEKFAAKDLETLRTDLLQSGVDSFQAAELVSTFLGGRGYGISTDEARVVASKIEGVCCTVERIEQELGRVARVA